MKFNKALWIAIALVLVWLVLGWFLGSWLGIKAQGLWYLRAGWWLLGIAGFVGYLVLRPKEDAAPIEGAAASAAEEIDYNFAEASKRIQAATGNKQLNSLPAIFVLGDAGAAKTSILTQSGIEPELVAGQAMQDGVVAPTRSVNLWYSRNTLFIDPSGALVADAGSRRKLFKKFLPVQLNSLLASKVAPTRSVLLTLDCDTFLQAGGANALAGKARDYQAILSELSRELGSSFPVYVLFTKADKIPYFRDFVENLTDSEVSEILGVSLPVPPSNAAGAFAEKQTLRLNNAFQSIYYSLADKRPAYLAREHVAANLSNIYEFPREFAKLKPLLVQFLTDLCRPSQLGTSPFLRGFYFTGVRPVTINDVIPASQLPVTEEAGFDSGATRMFIRPAKAAPIAEARQAGLRRVPQWVFLRNLFPGILLADRVGTSAAQVNVKVTLARRLALACVSAAALAMAAWWTVSYFNNQLLMHDAYAVATSVPNVGLASGQLAPPASLQKLSGVRDTLALLNHYATDGAPLSYRAGLYEGNSIRQPLRVVYYALFRRLLLQPTQQTLVEIASKPDPYGAQGYAGYQTVYNALKSYLITIHYPEHAAGWSDFVPVLMEHWKKDQAALPEQETQAQRNFSFYADDLANGSPYPLLDPDRLPEVSSARAFLDLMPLEDSIYRSMLDAAGDKLKPVIFNKDYPGTGDTVINVFKVDSWFTKPAYASFQKQLASADPTKNREEWVLGPLKQQQNFDKQAIVAHLKLRYDQDYADAWRKYLSATREPLPYGSYVRAASVLEKLGGPQSALMLLFCVASENTTVASPQVTDAFQPEHVITPAGCLPQMNLISPLANPYIAGLGNLSIALKAIGPAGSQPNQAAVANVTSAVPAAQSAENNLQLNFRPDPTDEHGTVLNKTEALLKDPIEDVPPVLKVLAGAAVNGSADAMCAAMNPLFQKYPFNPASKEDASLPEMNEVLNPQSGKLWAFVNSVLAPFVQKVGSDYIAGAGQTAKVTPAYLAFLNRAAHLTQALYHGDPSGNPSLTFVMTALPAPDVDHVSLSIDGATLTGAPQNRPSQTFTWPGPQQGASLQARFGGSNIDSSVITNRTGLWAVWHVVDRAERGADNSIGWTIRAEEGPVMMNGHPETVKFSLDPQAAQILRPQFFGGMSCVSKAVQ